MNDKNLTETMYIALQNTEQVIWFAIVIIWFICMYYIITID
jgi:VanZ family protein